MTISHRLHDTCVGSDEVLGNLCRCCCDACIDMKCKQHTPDHSACPQGKRYWWYKRDEWDWSPYQLLYFGSDEFCNRTIVLRLWRPLVIALNTPLRRESCDECLALVLGEEEPQDPPQN